MLSTLSLYPFNNGSDKSIKFAVTTNIKLNVLFCAYQLSDNGIYLIFYKEKIVNFSMSYK